APPGIEQIWLSAHSVSTVHWPIGSQTRLSQRSLGSPQSESWVHSCTQIRFRGSHTVPNGQVCAIAMHLPRAESHFWLKGSSQPSWQSESLVHPAISETQRPV